MRTVTTAIVGPHNEAAVAALKSKATMVTIFGKPGVGKSHLAEAYSREGDKVIDALDGFVARDDIVHDGRVIILLPRHPRECALDDWTLARMVSGVMAEISAWGRNELMLLLPESMPIEAKRAVLARCPTPSACAGASATWAATEGMGEWPDRLRGVIGSSPHRRKTINPFNVLEAAADYYGVTNTELVSPRRTKPLVTYRHVAMYLAREICELATLKMIGTAFGGRDHSTVLHGINVIRSRVLVDTGLSNEVDVLRQRILGRQ